jgi:hypothetical protein
MDIDPAQMMVGLMAARAQQLTQIAVLKKQHEMELDLSTRLTEVATSAPVPGAGQHIDKLA